VKIILTAALTAALLTAGGAAATDASASEAGPSQVTGNGTWQVQAADGSLGPVHHGRRTISLGAGEGIFVTAGSCKTVDPDGTVWGPIWAEDGGSVTCYGSDNDW
jgi:hypothetical protein